MRNPIESRIRALEKALEELSEQAAGLDAGKDPFSEEPMAVTVEGEDPESISKGLEMADDMLSSGKIEEMMSDEDEDEDDKWIEGDLDTEEDPEMLDKLLRQRFRR